MTDTINITTGEFVNYDYSTGEESVILDADEIFCCNDVFESGYLAVDMFDSKAAGIGDEIENPEILYVSNPLSIITSEGGRGCAFLEYPEVSRNIKNRIFHAEFNDSGCCTMIGEVMQFELNTEYLNFGKYFEHGIEDIFGYTKLHIGDDLMLYKNCRIINYNTRTGYSAPVEQLLNDLEVLEYGGTIHYIDTKLRKSFRAKRRIHEEILKHKEKIVNFALSYEILKLYMTDGNMLVCAQGEFFMLDSNDDNYLPQPRKSQTKSANN